MESCSIYSFDLSSIPCCACEIDHIVARNCGLFIVPCMLNSIRHLCPSSFLPSNSDGHLGSFLSGAVSAAIESLLHVFYYTLRYKPFD